jgi:hypothetical protein
MASSLILAIKKLSTILYRALISIDNAIGTAMDITSGNTFFVFM